jgi:hypothetical protein
VSEYVKQIKIGTELLCLLQTLDCLKHLPAFKCSHKSYEDSIVLYTANVVGTELLQNGLVYGHMAHELQIQKRPFEQKGPKQVP